MFAKAGMLAVRTRDAWRSIRASRKGSIGLGFAWPGPNVGGVRRHLDCIACYSRFHVCEYPSAAAVRHWPDCDRKSYEEIACKNALKQALIHSHVEPSFVQVGRAAQQQGKPWVHTYHALYFEEDWQGGLKDWQRSTNAALLDEARHADVCISVSAWLAQWLREKKGIAAQFIPNGVDVGACDRASAARFSQKHHRSGFALFLGNGEPIKSPAAFVDLARRLDKRTFVMIGTHLSREALSQTVSGELPPNLHPLGPMSHTDALDAIAACRVFVMTSRREGLPTALLEAMAMSKPCVAPRGHGCLDAVGSDDCGFLYEPGDLDDLEAQTRVALGAEVLPAARQRVLDHFSWDVVMPRIDAVYARLLGV